MKSEFIINELWQLSIAGAFQRSGIYTSGADEALKKQFKSELKTDLEGFIKAQYFKPCDEAQHLKNIQELSEHTKKYAALLKNGQLNFGVSQKVLNLFLKYLWCLKLIPTPPHFPVDRLLQVALNKKAKANGFKTREIVPWTQLEDENDYLEIINFAEKIKNVDKAYATMSLAEMELNL